MAVPDERQLSDLIFNLREGAPYDSPERLAADIQKTLAEKHKCPCQKVTVGDDWRSAEIVVTGENILRIAI